MVGIVIISHGKLASALKTTAEMICGCQSQVETVEFLEGMTPEELKMNALKAIEKVNSSDGVLLYADLFGGTPARVIGELVLEGNYPAVAGVNLPMLLETCNMCCGTPVQDIKKTALTCGPESIMDINAALDEA